MKKYLKILVIAAIVFSLAAASVFLILNSGHECATHNCRVCVRIENAFGILKSAVSAGIALCFARIVFLIVGRVKMINFGRAAAFETPILLKVKLNN